MFLNSSSIWAQPVTFAHHTSGNLLAFTPGNGTTWLMVEAWGGGGGGGGGSSSSSSWGGGGGGGGYGRIVVPVTPGMTYPITVGMGGYPGNQGPDMTGQPGGTSSFGDLLTVTGGGGGQPGGTTAGTPGTGGSATGYSDQMSGIGVISFTGVAGGVNGTFSAGWATIGGGPNTGPGAGGGGYVNDSLQATSGADGQVIVYW